MTNQQDADRGKRWFVVRTKPFSEKLATANLRQQGFETYLPFAISAREVRGQVQNYVRPFFPGYTFVRFNPISDQWRAIFSTRYCLSMFMAGDRPAYFPDADIVLMRAHEENGLIKLSDPESLAATFKRGQAVKLRRGKLDFDAVFMEPVDGNRAIILVQHIGGKSSPQKVALLDLRG